MATETSSKNVTIAHLKKSLTRAKTESEKAISAIGGVETATDAEIDEMLSEVFGGSGENA